MKKYPKDIEYGSSDWKLYQYERTKEENRGHNYQYYNDEMWSTLEKKGYKFYLFDEKESFESRSTNSEAIAKEILVELRKNNFARIIAGYNKNVQRQKRFSVIYKPKS